VTNNVFRDATAVVGVGQTPYYKRGQSHPQTSYELAGKAILAAVADAGLDLDEVDGITYYALGGGLDTAVLAQVLGLRRIRWSVCVSGGGGGAAGSLGVSAAAVISGLASVVVTVSVSQHVLTRTTASFANPMNRGSHWDFVNSTGLVAPGQLYAMLARRHMHLYGTRREDFGAVAISNRDNSSRMPDAVRRERITMDDYLGSRMISDPFCLLDYCQETDGAAACITTSAERAASFPRPVCPARKPARAGSWERRTFWPPRKPATLPGAHSAIQPW